MSIEALELRLREAQRKKNSSFVRLALRYNDAGVSQQLFDAYEEFCASLEPEFGQIGGFSITCFGEHNLYTLYDPELELFKANVEIPYENCNYHCEASTTASPDAENIVELWPIRSPEPRTGVEVT